MVGLSLIEARDLATRRYRKLTVIGILSDNVPLNKTIGRLRKHRLPYSRDKRDAGHYKIMEKAMRREEKKEEREIQISGIN